MKRYPFSCALAFVIWCIALLANAQQPTWLQHYGTADGDNSGFTLAYDPVGFIYGTGAVAGATVFGDDTVSALGDRDILLVKWDTAGNVIWATTAGGIPDFQQIDAEGGGDIAFDPFTGNVLVAGRFSSDATHFGPFTLSGSSDFHADVFVACYSGNGTCLWVRHASGYSPISQALLLDSNSNIFSFGYASDWGTTVYGPMNIDIPQGGYVAKYDESGVLLGAEQTVHEGGIFDAHWIGNDWLVCGELSTGAELWGVPMPIQSPGTDAFVARVDTSGAVLWSTQLWSDNAASIYRCAATSDGKAMIAGTFFTSLHWGTDSLEGSPTVRNHFVAMVDAQGDIEWVHLLMSSNLGVPRDLECDANDQFLLLGRFASDIDLMGTTVTAATSSDGYLARIDTTGNCLAVWHYGRVFNMGSANVLPTDHGLYLGCEYDSTMNFGTYTVPTFQSGPDLFLARFDSLSGFTGIMRQAVVNEELHIYANPNNGLCTIDLPQSLQASDGLVLSVYDQTGHLVQQAPLEFTDQGLKLDVRAQAKGIYHVELTDGQQRYSGRIVFE